MVVDIPALAREAYVVYGMILREQGCPALPSWESLLLELRVAWLGAVTAVVGAVVVAEEADGHGA